MNKRLEALLRDEGENYILPFFWQHGEEEAVLREEIARIYDCGIRAMCVEARPHPDFAGPGWWHDMDIIMEEARARDMKVWVLDDAHFPTGYANGYIKNKYPMKGKQYVMVKHADVSGPLPQVGMNITSMAKTVPSPFPDPMASMFSRSSEPPRVFDDDHMLCVIATGILHDEHAGGEIINLTQQVGADGMLYWDVPAGMWRVFVFYITRNGGGRADYINVIDQESCRVQIEAVYEPHFAHYGADFGKTFAGFFSDEPQMGNVGGFAMDESIGRKMMPLPWNKDVPEMLAQALGDEWHTLLPALWYEFADKDTQARVRYAYMDIVTRLYAKAFCGQLGDWCAAHGVEYIGHIIEDQNQHTRLGCSVGHFFRSMGGQHMAGIDDIGNQVIFGREHNNRSGGFVKGDGEFFHYALGKLGSSLGHIDPKKKGRTMCEIYGAYGWSTGVRHMKWITDHFLVRGINYIVPHAFSPKEFPDPDCPPHFYARGRNPQYRHFQQLMRYANRLFHLLNGGVSFAPVGILYHAESEWSGGYMYLQKPARALTQQQIDFDILPSDVFANMSAFQADFDGKLHVNGITYSALVVPYSEYLTSHTAAFIGQARQAGFPVIFVDALPSGICDTAQPERQTQLLAGLQGCAVCALDQLPDYLRRQGIYEITLSQPFPLLTYYHYRTDTDTFLFNNEDPACTFDGTIDVPVKGAAVLYDAFANTLRPADTTETPDGTRLKLRLEPYEMAVVIFDVTGQTRPAALPQGEKAVIPGPWQLSFAQALEYPQFGPATQLHTLTDVNRIDPSFSGFMGYETTFTAKAAATACLELQHAFEAVEVWVNGRHAGMRICPPYRFDIGGLLQDGENTLRIEVANTLDNYMRTQDQGFMSSFFRSSDTVTPSGLLGEVRIYVK